LFARIDRYEGERRKTQHVERISLRERVLGIMDWLIARPALAGACAALVLAVIAVPMLTSRTAEDGAYEVLETPGAVTEQLRVRLRFQAAPAQADVERAVQASLAQQKLANPYRIERQPNGEYVVVFEKKPGVEAMSRLLEDLRRASNAADVTIDGG
jgi:glucose/arabinose dehydrogenase